MTDENLALADRLFDAIERGDMAALPAIYADEAIIWHTYDPIAHYADRSARNVADNVALLSKLGTLFEEVRYLVKRQESTSFGFVREHVLMLRDAAGSTAELPVAVIADVADGRITVLREYLNPMQIPASVAAAL